MTSKEQETGWQDQPVFSDYRVKHTCADGITSYVVVQYIPRTDQPGFFKYCKCLHCNTVILAESA